MILYIVAKTNVSDLKINSIVFESKRKELVLTWDESDTCSEEPYFEARFKGVYINGKCGNRKFSKLKKASVKRIVLDTSISTDVPKIELEVIKLTIFDNDYYDIEKEKYSNIQLEKMNEEE